MTNNKQPPQNGLSVWSAILLSIGVPFSALALALSLITYLSLQKLNLAPVTPTLSAAAKAQARQELENLMETAAKKAIKTVEHDITTQAQKIQALVDLQLSKTVRESAEVAEITEKSTAEPEPIDRIALGKTIARRQCASCHNFDTAQASRVGPNLFGIIGRPAGQEPNFRYSQTLQKSEIVWDPQTLLTFLENPKSFLPGTKMTYVGLPSLESRQHLVDYLASLEQTQ